MQDPILIYTLPEDSLEDITRAACEYAKACGNSVKFDWKDIPVIVGPSADPEEVIGRIKAQEIGKI